MKDITRINPRHVGTKGKYFNPNTMEIFDLTAEEIYYLRKYHHDDMNNPQIASGVKVIIRAQNVPKKTGKRKYKLTRDQKYNNEFYRLKQQLKKEFTAFIVVGGIIVSIVGGLNYLTETQNKNYAESVNYASSFEEPIFVIESEDFENEVAKVDEVTETIVNNEESNRKETIKRICDIYQVNFDVAYKVIEDLTENFSSLGYLEGKIEGVSCKGFDVVAMTDEELFIYIVRIIKQDPERWNISTDNLYIDNGYESGTDYCKQIEYVANVLGVDKYLMYAIVQSECGFNSELFLGSNNPAGMKNNSGDWWNFDTTEEGFLELGMEIIKYYHWIGEPCTSLDEETIAKIRDIHAPLSDGNDYWLPNVLEVMEYARNNSEELFGPSVQSNGLSH